MGLWELESWRNVLTLRMTKRLPDTCEMDSTRLTVDHDVVSLRRRASREDVFCESGRSLDVASSELTLMEYSYTVGKCGSVKERGDSRQRFAGVLIVSFPVFLSKVQWCLLVFAIRERNDILTRYVSTRISTGRIPRDADPMRGRVQPCRHWARWLWYVHCRSQG